jgi:plasmid stabilization system protein ParE
MWTATATRDPEAIGDYIARNNPSAARRTIQRIRIDKRAYSLTF